MAVALIRGDKGVNQLLVLTQVILSIQLPFAVWPLVYFTSSKRIMTVKYVQGKENSVGESGAPGFSSTLLRDGESVRPRVRSPSTMCDNVCLSGSIASAQDPEIEDSAVLDVQNFANGPFLTALAIFVAIMITLFNVVLLVQVATGQT